MNKMLLVLAVLLLLAPTAAPAGPMDTGVILDLMGAGVSEVSIQRYVQRNHFTFDLSAQDLKALKKAGASDSLISFLQDRETGAPSGERNEAARSQDGSGNGEEQGGEYGSGTYGVSVVAPYYFGFSYGYPYYYADYYYPYYYPYYGYSYYGYPYSYGYHYPYYGSGHGGHGSGVVSYWHDGHSGRGGSRPPSSGSSPHPPQGSRQGGGHPQGSSRSGGGHGGRR
jgi:hypothetical protein